MKHLSPEVLATLVTTLAVCTGASHAELAPPPSQTLTERAESGTREVASTTLKDAKKVARRGEKQVQRVYRAAEPKVAKVYGESKRAVGKGVQWIDKEGHTAAQDLRKVGAETTK